jgi:hypothetical protein
VSCWFIEVDSGSIADKPTEYIGKGESSWSVLLETRAARERLDCCSLKPCLVLHCTSETTVASQESWTDRALSGS